MSKYAQDKFGPQVISHEENPNQKFLEDAIQKFGEKKKEHEYKPTVTETRIDHE